MNKESGSTTISPVVPARPGSTVGKANRSRKHPKKAPPTGTEADNLFAQINSLFPLLAGSPDSDTLCVAAVCEIGRKLEEASALLGWHKFEQTLKDGKKVNLSPDTARRYMLISEHAGTIRAAGITTIPEAYSLAHNLVCAEFAGRIDAWQGSGVPSVAVAVYLNERRTFQELRRLPAADQPAFLAGLISKFTHLQSLLA